MTDVTISVVAFNQRSQLESLLPSLVAATRGVDAEIMLVANRSTDGTAELVSDRFPDVKLTINPRKAGYGANHNLNLRRARGRYFAVVNADMTVKPDAFSELMQFMDGNPDAGIVSPKVLNEDGTIQGLCKRYPTLLDLFLRRCTPGRLRPLAHPRLDYYEMRDVGYGVVHDTPFLSGAFMFCRAELLKSLGGFDERYFLYFEDVDLCRRVQRTHRTVYYPGVSVTHFWQRNNHSDWRHACYFFQSAARYFWQWGVRPW